MPAARFPLPARDRVILHLSRFGRPEPEGSCPRGITQDGIAEATGLARAHVALALRSLREEGLVEELKGRVAGEARRRKVYSLSDAGLRYSRELLALIMEAEVELHRDGAEPQRLKLSEASFLLSKKLPLAELAISVGERAVLSIGPDGLPVRAPGKGGWGSGEEGRALPASEGVGDAGPSPPRPTPESLLVETPTGVLGEPQPCKKAPATHPRPPEPPLVMWGRLAAVTLAGLALLLGLIFTGIRLGLPLPPDFLLTYFLLLLTIELVLLLAYEIPPRIRTELGVFTGTFIALYGGVLVLAPPLQSLLWLAQGLLILSTGLLLCPLKEGRGLQTAGAAAGAFMVLLGSLGALRPGELHLRFFSALWIPAGLLFIAARVYPGKLGLASHLRASAVMSAGLFLLATGIFFFSKGLHAEGLVELVVGGAVLYCAAPRRRENWSPTFIIVSTLLGLVVVLSAISALEYFAG
ncbi:MAG: hypothetical protein QXH42_06525 [Thermoplasmata archaeon]